MKKTEQQSDHTLTYWEWRDKGESKWHRKGWNPRTVERRKMQQVIHPNGEKELPEEIEREEC
jgi:hypothetical protein